ncbi:MAG: hypothetical protein M1829_005050 [Trizodia sp. TS-e1964]|nr:MAG: hypothetical protein M1829_005050 [Trizodia sp. TS-e1964]
MVSLFKPAWKLAQRAEQDLNATLNEKNVPIAHVTELINDLRVACAKAIFLDFEEATSHNIEARLWEAHSKLNKKYRRILSRFRAQGEASKRPVEKRKMIKHYLDFIKSSQRFYRDYINQLSSVFGAIPEILYIAHKFRETDNPTTSSAVIAPELKHSVILSCHQSLVRLGDLSRYRETELTDKDRNWGPATGYYDLAGAIYPASGASHNQLAVIALADGSHLRSTFHLYRALAVEEPYPTARPNLELEFKKILLAWEKGELITNTAGPNGQGRALIAWFVRLHARCYKGEEFSEHDELENEVLSQLMVELKERPLDGILQKFVLINVSAEYFAGVRLQENPGSQEHYQAFFFFLRLNVKTFFTLLQVLQPELERVMTDDFENQGSENSIASEKITAVARRILPALRNYSTWLVSNSTLLVAQIGDTALNVQIKEMWKIYANSLTLLVSTFPVGELPCLPYLLEEDEDTIGFTPFSSDNAKPRYFDGEKLKPKWHDPGVQRCHPNVEMLARVREFLKDGLIMAMDNTVPITLFEGGTFAFQEEDLPSESINSPTSMDQATFAATAMERDDTINLNTKGYSELAHGNLAERPIDDDQEASQSLADSETTSYSMGTTMARMVDTLTVSETNDLENLNYTDYGLLNEEYTSDNSNDSPTRPISPEKLLHLVQENGSALKHTVTQLPAPESTTTPKHSLHSIWSMPKTFLSASHSSSSLQNSSMGLTSNWEYSTPIGTGKIGYSHAVSTSYSNFEMSPFAHGLGNGTISITNSPPNSKGNFA